MPIHNGTEWKSEKAWWVKVGGVWKKSTTIWKKVSGVWEKMTLSIEANVASMTASNGFGPFYVGDYFYIDLIFDNDIYIDITANYPYRIYIPVLTSSGQTIQLSASSGGQPGTSVRFQYKFKSTDQSFTSITFPENFIYDGGDIWVGEYQSGTLANTYIAPSISSTFTGVSFDASGYVSTLAGSGTAGDDDGAGVLAEFNDPSGMDIDSGFAYICDTLNHKIRRLNLNTNEVTDFAGSGIIGDADGIGALAEFYNPVDIYIDSGIAYVCDSLNHSIRKLNLSTAEVTTFAGGGGIGSADGVGVLATFNRPYGISIASGDAYVCDYFSNKIRKINISTANVTTFAGSGASGDNDDIGILAEFFRPSGISIYSGSAYICDFANDKIRELNLSTAEVTTLAGSGTVGDADGVGVLAEFSGPNGVTTYLGAAYIGDTQNNKVRKINLSTAEVTTLAGSGTVGSADGAGVLAEFEANHGITANSGIAYVCDTGNNKIRTVTLE